MNMQAMNMQVTALFVWAINLLMYNNVAIEQFESNDFALYMQSKTF